MNIKSSSNSASAVSSPAQPSIAEPAVRPACAPRSPVPLTAAAPRSAAPAPRPVLLPVSAAPAKPLRRDFASVTASAPGVSSRKPVAEKAPKKVEDGFVTVQKKCRQRTNKNCCGTAPEEPNMTFRTAMPNAPVYISRIHYTTNAEDIVEYLRQKAKTLVRVQLLESRRNANFKAFVVRVPKCLLHLVMEENFWPEGVVFRRFRGQVHYDRTMRWCSSEVLLT